MTIKRIITLILVFSMFFINSSFVYADESSAYYSETTNIDEQNVSKNNIYFASSINIDDTEFKGQIKSATSLYDMGSGIYQTDSFASYYFSHLDKNFGNNTIGSCGYVATAMMLSYYDAYLNDHIIDEAYDVPSVLSSLDLTNVHFSPGIRRENDSLLGGSEGCSYMISELDTAGYWQLVENNYLNYFQLYLIKLAECEFDMYHNVFVTLEENGIIDQTGYPCASTLLHQKILIEHYLYNIRGLEGQVSVEYANTDVRNFAINKIKNGQPVMLLLGSSTGFHFVVAYDLNDQGTEDTSDDEIYAHYGWNQVIDINGDHKKATHLNIDTDRFPWLVSAMALNFNLEHSCSDNYSYGGETYCPCFLMCHPDHEYLYTYFNSLYHIGECVNCGHESEKSIHRWRDFSSTHVVCLDCGQLKRLPDEGFIPIIKGITPDPEDA